MFIILKMAFKNLIRQKRRTLSVFFAILIAVLVIEFVNGFVSGFKRMGYDSLNTTGHIRLVRMGYEDKLDLLPLDLSIENYQQILEQLSTIEEINRINYDLKFGAVLSSEMKSLNVIGLGIDPLDTFSRYKQTLSKGKFIESKDDIFLSSSAAAALGTEISDNLIILTQDSNNSINALEVKICGFFESLTKHDENVMLMHIQAAQDLLRMQNEVTEILLFLKDPQATGIVIDKLNGLLDKNQLAANEWKNYNQVLAVLMELLDDFMLILVFIILIIGGTGIINTFLTSVFERIKEIGTLRAIGMKKLKIFLLFITEASLLGFISSVFGCGLGSLLVIYFSQNGIFMGGGANLPGIGTYFYTHFTWEGVIASLISGTLISLFAILYPLFLAIKVRPIEAVTFSK